MKNSSDMNERRWKNIKTDSNKVIRDHDENNKILPWRNINVSIRHDQFKSKYKNLVNHNRLQTNDDMISIKYEKQSFATFSTRAYMSRVQQI